MTDDSRAFWETQWRDTFDTVIAKPVSIIEFAEVMCSNEHHDFKLYPNQKIALKMYAGEALSVSETAVVEFWRTQEYVPPDIWERYENATMRGGFAEFVMVLGRRGSKSFMSSLIACYEIYKLLLKKHPHKHYNMLPNEPITVAVVASTGTQASEALFPKIKSLIAQCKWLRDRIPREGFKSDYIVFQTDGDRELDARMKTEGKNTVTTSVKVQVFNAESGATRGRATIVVIFDEMAHYQNRQGRDNAYNMYEALGPSTADFGKDGRIIAISSPLYEAGQFFDLYTGIWEGRKPNSLGLRLPSWVMYERAELIDREPRFTFASLKIDSETIEFDTPEWWREYGAQFQKNVSIYMIADHVENMFAQAETFNWEWQDTGNHIYYYHGHGDPAKNHAGFPLLVGHYDPRVDKVFVDWAWRWKVRAKPQEQQLDRETFYPPNSIIDYEDVENHLQGVFDKFTVRRWTFDQWNSIGSIQRLRKYAAMRGQHTQVEEFTFSGTPEYDAYEKLRNEMRKGRVVCPRWLPLQRELNNIWDKGGKIVPADAGPVRTKDIADCLAIVVTRCLEDADIRGRTDKINNPESIQQLNGVMIRMPGAQVAGLGGSMGETGRRDTGGYNGIKMP